MIEANTPTMFDLTEDFRGLVSMGYPEIDYSKDSDEEIANKQSEIEAFEDTLNTIMACIADKADAYCYCLNTIQDRSNRLKAEINRLETWKKSLDNAEKRMKDALKYTLETMRAEGIEKPEIITPLHRITLQKNGGTQKMEITGEVPDNYKRVVYEDDKEKIKAALQKGENLGFARLLPRGEHVAFK